MEHENMYASKGVAGAGLGIAIGSLGAGALGLFNGNGLFGNRAVDPTATPVTRFELEQSMKIAALETEIKLRDSYIYTDGKIAAVEQELGQQRVYNATLNGAIGCIQGQIAQLMALTKLVIPNGSVCPGFGNVTVTPATTTTG